MDINPNKVTWKVCVFYFYKDAKAYSVYVQRGQITNATKAETELVLPWLKSLARNISYSDLWIILVITSIQVNENGEWIRWFNGKQYGYYFKSIECNRNTSINSLCTTSSGKQKIRTSGRQFYAECESCNTRTCFTLILLWNQNRTCCSSCIPRLMIVSTRWCYLVKI